MNKERIASLEERETKNDKVRDHRLQQDIVLVTAGSKGAFKLEGRIVRRRGTSQGISEPRHSFVCYFFLVGGVPGPNSKFVQEATWFPFH